MKSFFSELPDPLVPYNMQIDLVEAHSEYCQPSLTRAPQADFVGEWRERGCSTIEDGFCTQGTDTLALKVGVGRTSGQGTKDDTVGACRSGLCRPEVLF